MKYRKYIHSKMNRDVYSGFRAKDIPEATFDFQSLLIDWSASKGRSAILADCGLGKTLMQLAWANNAVRSSNAPCLLLTPLAVTRQTIREAGKFGIEISDARLGRVVKGINVVNYERLDKFDNADFGSIVCDESSILKNFDGKRRRQITKFARDIKFRLLCSATPAPNDFHELGTSSEALGYMSRNQMLGMFFSHRGDKTQAWELKGHARRAYWRWVSSWARTLRKPSDLGDFDDTGFVLPELKVYKHLIGSGFSKGEGGFFEFADTLKDQRREKRETLQERCDKLASLVPGNDAAVVFCHLNEEADLLEKMISDSKQVAGRHSDEMKEETIEAFSTGDLRVLITKPRIGAFGMNWQHCSNVMCFPSHSYEQYYQMIRRCWRFGQKHPVKVHVVGTEAETPIIENMMRKERQVNEVFDQIINEMHDFQIHGSKPTPFKTKMRNPSWL